LAYRPDRRTLIPIMNFTEIDRQMMLRCVELARRAVGKTSPNPLVGAIIVRDDRIVGEGYHPKAGEPHAEIFALREARENALNATVYVNLEPCNHYGRTPPCTESLIRAGVQKVVVGSIDPDPRVAGSGVAKLREAGIEVIVGVEKEICDRLNEAFFHRVQHRSPFGILKYAMTLDGKIAASTGHSAWVTSSASRHYVHELRGEVDAVIVGGNTVRQDNPYLTIREAGDRNPLRVVLSPSFNLPENCHLWDTNNASTVIFTQENKQQELQQKLRDRGVEIITLENLSPKMVMQNLAARGFNSVLWECGGVLSAKAIVEGTVQKIIAFIAPKIIGGNNNFSPVGDLGLLRMTDAFSLEQISIWQIETDFLIEGYFLRKSLT
jgi:diaminohydroxyphosphoribosylaminopyrimidine deaminase / 5-amino-6-(5-phosphoribosylamino)uracil reductase